MQSHFAIYLQDQTAIATWHLNKLNCDHLPLHLRRYLNAGDVEASKPYLNKTLQSVNKMTDNNPPLIEGRVPETNSVPSQLMRLDLNNSPVSGSALMDSSLQLTGGGE